MENKSFGGVAGTDEAPTLINKTIVVNSEKGDVENEMENMGDGIDKKINDNHIDVKNPSGPTDEEEQGNTLSMSWLYNNG